MVRYVTAVGVLGTALPLVGIAVANAVDEPKTIYACLSNQKGTLRMDDEELDCVRGETEWVWNQQGPAGPQGPEGPQGPAGPAGADVDLVTVPPSSTEVYAGAGTVNANTVYGSPIELQPGRFLPTFDGTFQLMEGSSVQVRIQRYDEVGESWELVAYKSLYSAAGGYISGGEFSPFSGGGLYRVAVDVSVNRQGYSSAGQASVYAGVTLLSLPPE